MGIAQWWDSPDAHLEGALVLKLPFTKLHMDSSLPGGNVGGSLVTTQAWVVGLDCQVKP